MSEISQLEHWNGPVGQKWVDFADPLDLMLEPLSDALLSRAVIQQGENVLDIGCGAGALTMPAADLVGDESITIGVDVSAPLIQLAKQRARTSGSRASFELADAATYCGPIKFDIGISRLGVMFFEDPIAALANIRKQVKPGGGLAFVCWQSVQSNPWLMEPIRAAAPFLQTMPSASHPDAPGPFSFADKDRLSRVLDQSGWKNVSIEPLRAELTLPGTSTQETAALMIQLGPIAGLIRAQNLDASPILEAVEGLMEARMDSDGRVRMESASWLVSATTN